MPVFTSFFLGFERLPTLAPVWMLFARSLNTSRSRGVVAEGTRLSLLRHSIIPISRVGRGNTWMLCGGSPAIGPIILCS